MTLRALVTITLVLLVSQTGAAPQNARQLNLGFVLGSVAFAGPDPLEYATDAPSVILRFNRTGGQRGYVLTDEIGDYKAVLEPGHYCATAYTIEGKPLQVYRNQGTCFDVTEGEYARQDLALVKS